MIWRTKNAEWDFSQPTQRALVMGILNVTSDSFSDGGKFLDLDAATARAREMIEQGADIIDIGGESTRPGAEPVSAEIEMSRVLPVIERISAQLAQKRQLAQSAQNISRCDISIDTSKASVARAAIERGAGIINDVTGLRGDPQMIEVARESGAGVIVMHMRGTPRDMQRDPRYENVVADVREFFRQSFALAVKSGIQPERIAFDPGIGFGKTAMHNFSLIRQLDALRRAEEIADRPLVLGVSRKWFIGKTIGSDEIADRDLGTAALTALGRAFGANIFRVHDVKGNVQALKITEAVLNAP